MQTATPRTPTARFPHRARAKGMLAAPQRKDSSCDSCGQKLGKSFDVLILPTQHKGPVSGAFRVAGAGFEPATSGLCALQQHAVRWVGAPLCAARLCLRGRRDAASRALECERGGAVDCKALPGSRRLFQRRIGEL
jgi:hypothetical protein